MRKRVISLSSIERKVILICFGFALQRSVIGLEISRHLLNQSDAKLKPILATCIYFELSLAACDIYHRSDWPL